MAVALHCDRSDCDTWSYDGENFIFVSYSKYVNKYYCCKWCMVVEESKNDERRAAPIQGLCKKLLEDIYKTRRI